VKGRWAVVELEAQEGLPSSSWEMLVGLAAMSSCVGGQWLKTHFVDSASTHCDIFDRP
jgi:hypothetical protein